MPNSSPSSSPSPGATPSPAGPDPTVPADRAFDLLVLGAGPAGIAASAAAGLFGKRVALVERSPAVGGAGINTGTIPSKTLRETALVLSGIKARQLTGFDLALDRQVTVPDLMRHESRVCAAERIRAEERLRKRGVRLLWGAARFVSPHHVAIRQPDGTDLCVRGERILIATGSSPVRPAEFPFGDDRVHDSNEILELRTMPRKLVVVGAGVVGAEYASIFAALGVETHLLDGRAGLLPFLDPEISAALAEAMAQLGVRFRWKTRVTACDASRRPDLALTLSDGSTLACDGLLVCAGRESNTADLDLAKAGLVPGERGLIKVNDDYATVVPHIYAAGDVIGPPALAATSIEQARIAVVHAFGLGPHLQVSRILPTGIYTIPETSRIGETEAEAKARGVDCVVGRARYEDMARGQIMGDRFGFLKLVFRRADFRLLGVHALGEQATELVHIGQIALLAERDARFLTGICFNYPTLGDLYKYAAFDALFRAGAFPGLTATDDDPAMAG